MALISKSLQPTPKQSRWINSTHRIKYFLVHCLFKALQLCKSTEGNTKVLTYDVAFQNLFDAQDEHRNAFGAKFQAQSRRTEQAFDKAAHCVNAGLAQPTDS